ncbi:MAG: hypothetical protein J6B45_05655 [Clostridia bacterium]|nr:hypothetical protein [Clostridia bacterium]
MKNILLIGDSIRYGASSNPEYNTSFSPGYGVYVKEMLSKQANVYAPDDNCRFAQYTLRYLYDWAKDLDCEKIDVIHWNNGLWDVLRINGDEPLTPICVYELMLGRIHDAMRKIFPNAKIIFALSTAVIEEWARPDFFRNNSDIEKYNEAAKRVMKEKGVIINDLYSISAKFDDSLHADWVHFNEEGSKILAKAVVEKILSV